MILAWRFVRGTIFRHTGIFVASRTYTTKMLKRVLDVLKDVSGVGEVKDARIVSSTQNDTQVMVEVTWSSRNLSTKERTFTTRNYFVQDGVADVIAFPPINIDKNVILRRISPSGKLTACVVSGSDGKESNENEHITITTDDGVFKTYDLTAADKHDKVYADVEFSCLEFNEDESKLVYIAEKRRGKPKSYLSPAPKSGDEDMRGKEYDFHETWGEQLEGKSQSVVCILDLNSGEISVHSLPDGLAAAQCIFIPGTGSGGGWTVVGVGFITKPYRLGLIYCHNRESHLFKLDSQGNFEVLGSKGYNIQSPWFSPDIKHLAYIRAELMGPHAKVSQLCILDWTTKQERVLIDVVDRERQIQGGVVFRGICGDSTLPRKCWSPDSTSILFSSYTVDTIYTYCVSLRADWFDMPEHIILEKGREFQSLPVVFIAESGEISRLGEGVKSQRIWDAMNGVMLIEESSLYQPTQFIITPRLTPTGQSHRSTQQVTTVNVASCFPDSYFTRWMLTNPDPHPDPKYSDISIPVLYFGPSTLPQGSPKRPLIVCPHGGPHSAFMNTFSVQLAFYVRLGFCILLPNYRGSLGMGQDGVKSLPGNCGNTDVSDVQLATMSCLQRFEHVIDKEQVFLNGGSHGGFLVTHLAAQHPTTYKAVVSRNPVTHIATMSGSTDIPDWCFVESGFDYKYGLVADNTTLGQMFTVSPISHVDTLKAPVLFLVGNNDLRVPPSQAIHLYKMLLARGVETKLQLYPDNHPLRKVGVEVDTLVHSALWFINHGASIPQLT